MKSYVGKLPGELPWKSHGERTSLKKHFAADRILFANLFKGTVSQNLTLDTG